MGVQHERSGLDAVRLLQWLYEGVAKVCLCSVTWFATHVSSSGSCNCHPVLGPSVAAACRDQDKVKRNASLTCARSAIFPVPRQLWPRTGAAQGQPGAPRVRVASVPLATPRKDVGVVGAELAFITAWATHAPHGNSIGTAMITENASLTLASVAQRRGHDDLAAGARSVPLSKPNALVAGADQSGEKALANSSTCRPPDRLARRGSPVFDLCIALV